MARPADNRSEYRPFPNEHGRNWRRSTSKYPSCFEPCGSRAGHASWRSAVGEVSPSQPWLDT